MIKSIIKRDGRVVLYDEGKIASAVQNLLSNAFKYTPSGGRVLLSVSHLMRSVAAPSRPKSSRFRTKWKAS